jgi:hypothetical protein
LEVNQEKGNLFCLIQLLKEALKKYSASELKFLLCDCKGVEFNEYTDSKVENILACESSSSVEKIVENLNLSNKSLKAEENFSKGIM